MPQDPIHPVEPKNNASSPAAESSWIQKAMLSFRVFRQSFYLQLILSLVIIGVYGILFKAGVFNRSEDMILDYFFRIRPPIAVHAGIAFVEISEDSIQGIGRWPWTRDYHAALTHFLSQLDAKAIVFDMLFSEPSTPEQDGALSQAIQESGKVYLPVVLESQSGGEHKLWIHSLPAFESAMKGQGHINVYPDRDGTIRRIKPFLKYQTQEHPHIALRVAYDYLGKPLTGPSSLSLPTDGDGNILINWAGEWEETFEHYSYLDLLQIFSRLKNGTLGPSSPEIEKLRHKIWLIGLTATGHSDIKAAPMAAAYPAVGVLANVINSVLHQNYIRPARQSTNLLLLLLAGLVSTALLLPFRNVLSLVSIAGFLAAWVLTAYFLFLRFGIWIHVLQPAFLSLTIFIFAAALAHLISNQEQLRLFQLSTRDGLTGAYVIRHFKLLLQQAMEDSQLKKESLALILIDIDHFKEINDTYGHQAGDMIVKETVRKTTACIRYVRQKFEEDAVGRYGGDEFIVLLKKCTLQDAAERVSMRLLQTLRETDFRIENKKIQITLSIGVASLHENEPRMENLIQRADEALYRAKKGGRNRICMEGRAEPLL